MPWGAVAAAAIGAAGSAYAASQRPDSRTTTSKSTAAIPDWLSEGSQNAVDMASQMAKQGYDAEAAQDALGLTNLGKSALVDATRFSGSYRPQLSQAKGYLANAADELYRNADFSQYVNPYVDNVLNESAEDLSRAYQQKLNRMDASAVERGAFGGMRAALADDMATDSYLDSVSDLYTQGRARAHNVAAQRFAADRAYQRGLSEQYAALAGLGANLRTQQMQAKMGAGALKRGVQTGLYTEARDFKENEQLQPLLAAISSSPYSSSTSSTSVNPQVGGNPWVSGIGGAIAGYGAYNSFMNDDDTQPTTIGTGYPAGPNSVMYVEPTGY